MTDPPHCAPARAIATRIFRSRRGSSIRAIAAPSSPSTNSSASPTTSPITPRLASAEKLDLLDRLEAGLARPAATSNGGGGAARRACASGTCRPATPRTCLTAFRMDVTKLRYRDWDDLIELLQLFGHAGRPLRARRAWREPRDLAGQRCAVRGAADHQPSAGLREGLPALDRVYIPEDALAAAGATVEDLGARRGVAGAAELPDGLAERTGVLLDDSAAFSAAHQRFAPGLEVAVIQSLARRLVGTADDARSAERARASWQGGAVAGSACSAIIAGTRRPLRPRRRRAACNPQCMSDSRGRDQHHLHRRASQRASGSSFYIGDAHPAARAARGDVRDLSLLPRGRRHRRLRRPARRRGIAQLARLARRHQCALCRQASAPQVAGLAEPVRRLRAAPRGFPRRHRRHGNGRRATTSARPTSPRSTSTATGWRARSAGLSRARVRHRASDDGIALAHHLGRALQLTNILRDLDEDAGIGRLYLPREALRAGRHRRPAIR